MKAYNGVATLSRQKPERVMYGLHEGPDNEDVRILQTVIDGVPIVNTYVPQGSRSSPKSMRSNWHGSSEFGTISRRILTLGSLRSGSAT